MRRVTPAGTVNSTGAPVAATTPPLVTPPAATCTVTDLVVSVLPATSVEYQYTVCETVPDEGAGTDTMVPVVHGPAVESSCQRVEATPEPFVSVAVSAKVWSPVYVPAVALHAVTGATVSMRKLLESCAVSVLPARSTE